MGIEQRETNEPNEAGFAGDPSTPQPEPDHRPAGEIDAEEIAVPDDLTAAAADPDGEHR